MPQTVGFHFDFLSPYAYLAWHALQRRQAERTDLTVLPIPTVLAALLNAAGQKGPAEIPAKRPYVLQDAVRGAHKLGVPLHLPPSHPFHPLLSLRVVCAAPQDQKSAVVTALFSVAWGGARFGEGGLDVPAVVTAALDHHGLDGEALVERAQSPEVKATLRTLSDAAVAAGIFGVPSMVLNAEAAGGTLFWGFDALGYLDDALDGHDPAGDLDLSQWAALPATARRQ